MRRVSCRTVMIYFDRPVQDRAIGLFHQSLARQGFQSLVLEQAVTLGEQPVAMQLPPD